MPEIHKGPDGLEEYDNPLPRWWLMIFYGSIVFAAIYSVIYPSTWFWEGTQGWTSSNQYQATLPTDTPTPIVADLAKIAEDPAAITAGQAIFVKNCQVCHGEKGEGKVGPSLIDNDWKYGAADADVLRSIRKGRPGGMPVWGKILTREEIEKVAAYVRHALPKASNASAEHSTP